MKVREERRQRACGWSCTDPQGSFWHRGGFTVTFISLVTPPGACLSTAGLDPSGMFSPSHLYCLYGQKLIFPFFLKAMRCIQLNG